ncbi:phosphodiester glycosidase family protein [bacterium]|nr:phosphodiester glycosidase family protein [bacterium]
MKKLFFLTLISILFLPFSFADVVEYQNDDVGVHVFKIDTNKYGNKIKPIYSQKLMTTKRLFDTKKFELVVNGGYFDAQNGKSVSNIIINEKSMPDIKDYPELYEKLKQDKRLDNVLSRSELRILEHKNNKKLKFDIARHNDPINKNYKILHLLQAGPMLYPDMDLEGEGFIVKNKEGEVTFQAIDILKRRERTVIGLKGKWLYIVIFTKDHRLDGNEMRDYMRKNLKVKKAMGLDGGLSTSFNYKNISIGSLEKYQRRVKSFLVVER